MSAILILSIAIRLMALAWAIRLLLKIQDWRIGFLAGMIALMAARQSLTLLKDPDVWPISFSANVDELPGLIVSVLALLALLFLERMIRDESRKSAQLAEANKELQEEALERGRAEEILRKREELLETTFESMSQGFAVYDGDLRLTAFNQKYLDLRSYPPGFIRVGMSYEGISRFRAKRGDYGPGDVEELVKIAMGRARQRTVRERELTSPDGMVTFVHHDPLPDGGHVVTITDITERKKAEEEIAEKSALLETTFESMSQGIRVLDEDLKIVAFNQRYVDLLGFPPGLVHVGMPFEEIVRFRAERGDHGAVDVEAYVRSRVVTRRRGEAHRREQELPGGIVVFAHHEPIPGSGYITTYTDITERRKAEKEIAGKSAVLETTFESMSQGITVFDADLKLIAFNQKYIDIIGYPADFIRIGKPFEEIARFRAERGEYGPGDAEKLAAKSVKAARQGKATRDELTRPDGAAFAIRRDPLPDGGFVTTLTDITERKRAEQEIAEKSALLETTFETMSQGIVVYDAELKLVTFNEKYVDLWGYPPGFIRLGITCEEVVRFKAERGDYGSGGVERKIRERIRAHRRGEASESEFALPNGKVIYFCRNPLPGGGSVTTLTDITERKRAEQEIAGKSAVLETTFESMSQGITVFDADLKLIAFNQRYLDIRDYPEEFFHLGQSYEKIVRFNAERGEYGPGYSEKQVRERIDNARRGTPWRSEYTRSSGTSIAVQRDPLPGGGFVTTFTDVTERKKAQEEIAEKSVLLETTFENMARGFAIYDADFKLAAFNRRYVELMDYPAELIRIGQSAEEMLRFKAERGDYGPGDIDEIVERHMALRRRGEKGWREHNHSDGTVIAVRRDPMPDGGYVATYTDITERKRAEQEIAEKSALLETTFESMSQGMTVYDADLKLIGFNQKYIEILGYPADFIRIGMPFEEIARFRAEQGDYGPGDAEKLAAKSVKAARQGKAMRSELTRPDGAVFAVRRDPLPDGGFVTTLTDITERKRAEWEIEQKSALLETTFENIAHGFAVYDVDDRLAAFNQKYVDFCDYPPDFARLGMSFEELSRFRAAQGYYGPGDAAEQVRERMESRRKGESAQHERIMPDGRVVVVRRELMPGGGYVSTFTDITELRKAEKEIAEKSAVLERTFESMSQGITVYDADHRLVAFNPRFVELFDFPSGFLRAGKTFEDLARVLAEQGEYGPGDVDELVRKRVTTRDRGDINPRERTRPDGTVISARRDPMPGGGYVTTYTDITERKRAEQEIAEKSALLETTLESMSQGITVYDADHKLVAFNPRFVELFDFPPGFLRAGKTFEDLARFLAERGEYGPGDVEKLVRKRVAARDRGDINRRERTRPNGSVIWTRRDPMPGGGSVTTYTDITERKRAETALRESEELFSKVFHASPGMFTISRPDDGAHHEVSENWIATMGYSRDEAMAQTSVELGIWADIRDRARFVERLKREGSVRDFEAKYRTKSGEELDVLVAGEYIEFGGEPHLLVVSHDITARKRAEEALRTRETRLSELQTELLNVSRQSAMGELSSALAHELNQPLAAIMNYVQASRRVIKKDGGVVSEKAYRMMDKALDQADRAGAIMRGLRDIVEKGEAARAESDINKVVEEASALGLIGAARAGIRLDLELGNELPPVNINEIQIQQVVMNLVRNGVEAMTASEKRDLTIKTALDHDNTVEIAIADTGPGLAEEVEKRLFQPFVTTKAGGMGIGLSISHSIVEAHGGRLWATPNPDGGTVFHFTLPLAPNGAEDNDE